MTTPVFKPYSPQQAYLLPYSLEELIPSDHPVRVVNQVIDGINLKPLVNKYKGGGTSSYHPAMLLKVIVYSYLTNIYSSRKMETALKENIHFMWLSAMNRPDHHTLNRFRSEKLMGVLKDIFIQVVTLLAEQGLVSLKELFVDGTKIEANANRYTFVWGKTVKNNKEKIKKQLEELWKYSQQVALSEEDLPEPPTFEPVDPEQVAKTIEQINEVLKDKPVSPKIKQKLSQARKRWPALVARYNEQEQLLAERNSYSKTDTDATFMRMKEDHLSNGQLKPAYNLQLSTSGQFIVNYSLHASATDTNVLQQHLEEHLQNHEQKPEVIVADAGYGSEENYEYLEKNHIEAYVKYNLFDQEQTGKHKRKYPFAIEYLHYNKQKDMYYCPMGQPMLNIGTAKKVTATGFEQELTRYQAINCQDCPLRPRCHNSEGNRIISINHNLLRHKQKAVERLNSQTGQYYRKRRGVDVEPVFGNIKSNYGFRRFMLRGKEKVSIEAGLLAIAHNLRKKAA
jgi:transposase